MAYVRLDHQRTDRYANLKYLTLWLTGRQTVESGSKLISKQITALLSNVLKVSPILGELHVILCDFRMVAFAAFAYGQWILKSPVCVSNLRESETVLT